MSTCWRHSPSFALTLLCLAQAACTGPQVRSVGNGGGNAAYELRGRDRVDLEAEALRLCPRGHDVVRSSVSFGSLQPTGNEWAAWLQPAGEWLSGMPGNQAQATIVCRG